MGGERYDGWYRWDPAEHAWIAHPDPDAGPRLTVAQMRALEKVRADDGPGRD